MKRMLVNTAAALVEEKDCQDTLTCEKLVVVISPDELKNSVFTNDPMSIDLLTTAENMYIESKLMDKKCPFFVEENVEVNFMKGTPLPDIGKEFPKQLIEQIEKDTGKTVCIVDRTGWTLRGSYDPQTWLFWIIATKRIGVKLIEEGIVEEIDKEKESLLEDVTPGQLNMFEKEGKNK